MVQLNIIDITLSNSFLGESDRYNYFFNLIQLISLKIIQNIQK